jgi:pimeloyl-ACP methyl ester carboxylesterase
MDRLSQAASRHGIAVDELVLPAEGMLRAGDSPAVHYLEWPGPRRTPQVLMLHGGGLHAHTFDLLGNLLRQRARCVALDLRGHGDSGWAESGRYGSEPIADDIEAAVSTLGLNDVVLIGHSLGGMGAMTWATRRMAALAGLIILDVAPAMNREGTGPVHEFVAANPTFADLEEVDNFLSQGTPQRAAGGDATAANLRWTDNGRLAFKYDTRQFAGLKLELDDDLRALATRIACPTMVLRGQRSKVISAEAAAELAGLIPGATWAEVPDARHTIQSSNPIALAAEINEFLQR